MLHFPDSLSKKWTAPLCQIKVKACDGVGRQRRFGLVKQQVADFLLVNPKEKKRISEVKCFGFFCDAQSFDAR